MKVHFKLIVMNILGVVFAFENTGHGKSYCASLMLLYSDVADH